MVYYKHQARYWDKGHYRALRIASGSSLQASSLEKHLLQLPNACRATTTLGTYLLHSLLQSLTCCYLSTESVLYERSDIIRILVMGLAIPLSVPGWTFPLGKP